jgi:hypothetical protein
MGFYLIDPLVTLIPLGSISSWAFKPYFDDGLLGISPTSLARGHAPGPAGPGAAEGRAGAGCQGGGHRGGAGWQLEPFVPGRGAVAEPRQQEQGNGREKCEEDGLLPLLGYREEQRGE